MAQSRAQFLEQALKEIADYAKLRSVDMGDTPEQQVEDWCNAARRCWKRAARALEEAQVRWPD